MDVAQSSIAYSEQAPEGVSEAARRALAPFAPRWSGRAPQVGVLLGKEHWLPAFRALKETAGFDYLVDHTAVDYPSRRPRFTVVGILSSLETQERLILKSRVEEGEPLASLTPLWKSANWAERETYDMFGIPFEGHPNLTRIYMPEDYEGWPLRRDFPLQGHIRFRD